MLYRPVTSHCLVKLSLVLSRARRLERLTNRCRCLRHCSKRVNGAISSKVHPKLHLVWVEMRVKVVEGVIPHRFWYHVWNAYLSCTDGRESCGVPTCVLIETLNGGRGLCVYAEESCSGAKFEVALGDDISRLLEMLGFLTVEGKGRNIYLKIPIFTV
ncbi:hypothetical protein AVEN_8493-1 [Araneus ventricosus]|uniref:Uncharacterized protein n=1 Tax=Araneus ventricosus TaxID=182803 RepID=A0A4Y2IZL1_ARAVE|nr:hypothetical protein AVEN_8493-1 [Araneus ventricosus]